MILRIASVTLVLLCAASAFAASTNPESVSPYSGETFFQSDPVPEDVTPVGNPLDWAGVKIGLDVRNFELPRAYEGEYRFVCRFPIIDYVSNRPLYMKQWTEDNAEALMRAQASQGIASVGLALEILTGDAKNAGDVPAISPAEHDAFKKQLAASEIPTPLQTPILELFDAFDQASQMVQSARAGLTAEDSAYFAKNPVSFLLPDGTKITDLTGNTEHQQIYIERLRRMRIDQVMDAGSLLSQAVQKYIDSTRSFRLLEELMSRIPPDVDVIFESRWGKVVISGYGNDSLISDAVFLIDLGGWDTYVNNAGGTNGGVAICIDHSGNDSYDAKERRYVQGCGVFGVGMLVDLGGDDSYTAKHFAQGAGVAGVGVLYDAAGNDTYSGHGFTQGAGMFGLGMLMDSAGDDSYDCATLSQGGATTMGLGVLSDLSGNDKFKLGTDTGKNAFDGLPGYGQGGALSFRPSPWRGKFTPYGGVGFLIDGSGNDDYLTNGWCDQGGSYIMSLGALYDGGGNDHYKANTGQGSGIHITNAILIDKSGNDHYEGAFRTGGSGSDRSPGILIDYEGNDTYQSGSSSYGTGCKPFSYSLMIDYSGDDNYITANPVGPILFNCWDSFGGVWPESAPNLYPWAIFLDLGGNDNYQVRNRANNSIRHSFGHGLQVDMEWNGGDVIGKVENPLQTYDFSKPRTWFQKNDSIANANTEPQWHSLNLFKRFWMVGQAANGSENQLDVIVRKLLNSHHRQMNRDWLELMYYYLIDKRFPVRLEPRLATLLSAADPEVRTIIADDIGVFGLKSCEDALVEALDDNEPSVRRFSYRSLMALKSEKGFKKAVIAVTKDNSEDVRRLALAYLTTVHGRADSHPPIATTLPDGADSYPLYHILIDRLENDPASSVKVAAADALGRLGNDEAVTSLRKIIELDSGADCNPPHYATQDVYVQRAAAKALCELGEVDGIGVLIETLSFPSIDAFYNYDYNVPNFIATYSGYDLPDPDRYDQAKWREWFAINRDKIDLKTNITASRAFAVLGDSLRGASDERIIELLEAFLKNYPANRNAAGLLAGHLNRIAWDMATAPKESPGYNPQQAIIYSRRSVELVSDLNYWDTLAEAYFAAGLLAESTRICEEQLKKSPGNRMFIDRLEKIKTVKK